LCSDLWLLFVTPADCLFSRLQKMDYKKILYVWALAVTVFIPSGCSDFNKVLKSTDIDFKYKRSVEYYEDGDCIRALALLEELIGLTRGTQRSEDVYYYYSKSQYCIKDYYLANYYFKSFSKTFSNSPRSQECLFLAAVCSYELSPEYSLDQMDTRNAKDEFQLFLDKYPTSPLRDSANHMMERLDKKLEIKSFEIAKLYHQTERYKAAVSALNQVLKDFPGTRFKEEILFLIVESNFKFAEASIESKKLERYRTTMESYITFVSAFPGSNFLDRAESYYKRSTKQVEKLSSINTQ
jgi:outer membrane protein assembly factor BamD